MLMSKFCIFFLILVLHSAAPDEKDKDNNEDHDNDDNEDEKDKLEEQEFENQIPDIGSGNMEGSQNIYEGADFNDEDEYIDDEVQIQKPVWYLGESFRELKKAIKKKMGRVILTTPENADVTEGESVGLDNTKKELNTDTTDVHNAVTSTSNPSQKKEPQSRMSKEFKPSSDDKVNRTEKRDVGRQSEDKKDS